MVSTKILSLTCTIMLSLPALGSAKELRKAKVDLTDPVKIGSTELKPGSYTVEWNGNGPTSVNFMKDHKTMATAPGKIIELNEPARNNAVVLKPTGRGQTQMIDEIEFAKHTQALQIEPTMLTKSSSTPGR